MDFCLRKSVDSRENKRTPVSRGLVPESYLFIEPLFSYDISCRGTNGETQNEQTQLDDVCSLNPLSLPRFSPDSLTIVVSVCLSLIGQRCRFPSSYTGSSPTHHHTTPDTYTKSVFSIIQYPIGFV